MGSDTSQWPVEVERNTRVAATPERTIAMKLPAAVSARLDRLVEMVETVERAEGGRRVRRGTTRKEMVAALILDAPPSRSELNEKLRKYRRASVRKTLLPRPTTARVILPGHRPGPRPTSDQTRTLSAERTQ